MSERNSLGRSSANRGQLLALCGLGVLALTAVVLAALPEQTLPFQTEEASGGTRSSDREPTVGVTERVLNSGQNQAASDARSVEPIHAAAATERDLPSGQGQPAGGARSIEPIHAAGTDMGRMVQIPAGTFKMGSNEGYYNHKPLHEVTLPSFEMDDTEVTVAAYQACVRAGACSPAASKCCTSCNWSEPGREQHPINCVEWTQARAYCEWVGKRLPVEEEWEYAARGPDGRSYPWGEADPGGQLCWNGEGNDAGKRNRHSTCVVGSYPADSPFGLHDMAGNVSEWTSTEYCDSYAEERNCCEARVVRGGAWHCDRADGILVTGRGGSFKPSDEHSSVGFRCARSLRAPSSLADAGDTESRLPQTAGDRATVTARIGVESGRAPGTTRLVRLGCYWPFDPTPARIGNIGQGKQTVYVWIPGDTCWHTQCVAKFSLSESCRQSEDDECVFGELRLETIDLDLNPRERRKVSLRRNTLGYVHRETDYLGDTVVTWSERNGVTMVVALRSGREEYLITLANAIIDSATQ